MNNLDTISSPADENPRDTVPAVQDKPFEEALKSLAAPVAPPSEEVGGLTLKKRAPSAKAAAAKPAAGKPGAASSARPGGVTVRTGPARTGPKPPSRRMDRFSRIMPSRDPGVRMNEQIRVPEVRVINETGEMVGVMPPKEAIELARSKQMDLLEIVPNAKPPVCKIIEFGKWKYEQQKKEKLAKKSSHQQLMKEVRFHPHTDTHDFEFKVRHARNFIAEGHKVKAYVQFKGREVTYRQFGEELLNNFTARMEDIAKVDQSISMMGRTMSMVLSPGGKKKASSDAKADAEKNGKEKAQPKPKLVKKAGQEAPAEEFETNVAEPVEATDANQVISE